MLRVIIFSFSSSKNVIVPESLLIEPQPISCNNKFIDGMSQLNDLLKQKAENGG